MKEKITVDLTVRLLDINNIKYLPPEYSDYGRCGIFYDGSYFFLPLRSMHPINTKYGYYWATDLKKDTIYISTRGSMADI